MAKTKRATVPQPFAFPAKPHRRVHGPKGHAAYQAYKPWLRDEFAFRCVYCLTRELWRDDGFYGFTADHVKPKSTHPRLESVYENLVYACARCNYLKSVRVGLPDPCRTSLSKHLKHRSGYFIAKTPLGRRLIEHLRLNEPVRAMTRLRHLNVFDGQRASARALLEYTFGYPAELPDLSRLKPPKGNTRPGGIRKSHFARRKAGTLPPYY
jgi:hypothetical protein